MTDLWSAPAFASFELREFGEEAVIFDQRDGRTHYLSPVASAILGILGLRNLETNALFACLETEFQHQFDQDERSRILIGLNQLRALGLVACSRD